MMDQFLFVLTSNCRNSAFWIKDESSALSCDSDNPKAKGHESWSLVCKGMSKEYFPIFVIYDLKFKLFKTQQIKQLIVNLSSTQTIGFRRKSSLDRLASIQKIASLSGIMRVKYTGVLVVQLVVVGSGLIGKLTHVLTAKLVINVHRL